MTIIYTSDFFSHHDTGQHPENKKRSDILHRHFTQKQGPFSLGNVPVFKVDSNDSLKSIEDRPWFSALKSVHQQGLIDRVLEQCQKGGGSLDPDTRVSQRSHEVALTAIATVCQSVDDVMSGNFPNALSLGRPPGHHATSEKSMGFCLFNNIAVAARYAQIRYSLDRVLIVDWDVHHGNGTQDIFYEDPTVGFFSIHRFPFYPGSGHEDEKGIGRGKGTTFNIPITYGTSREAYLKAFTLGVEKAARVMKPQLIFISAGFDGHAMDPVGDLGLKTEDFATMTDFIMDVAKNTCGGRVISSLEGGYHLETLRDCVALHAERLTKNEMDQ